MSVNGTAAVATDLVSSEPAEVFVAKVGTVLPGIDTPIRPDEITGVRSLGDTSGAITRTKGDAIKEITLAFSNHRKRGNKTLTYAGALAEFSRENQALINDEEVLEAGATGDLAFTLKPNESTTISQYCLIVDYVGEDNKLQRDVIPCGSFAGEDNTTEWGRDTDVTTINFTFAATKVTGQALYTTYGFNADGHDEDATPPTP